MNKYRIFIMRLIFKLVHFLLYPLQLYLSFKKLAIIGRDGTAIGDQLNMTSIIDYLGKKYKFKFIVITSFSVFFENNPNINKVVDRKKCSKFKLFIYNLIIYSSRHKNIIGFRFYEKDGLDYTNYMRETQSKLHIRSVFLMDSYYFNEIKNKKLNNKIYFSKDEIDLFEKKYKFLPKNFILFHSQSKTSYTVIKDWGFQNYQELVNLSYKKYNWIQCGSKDEPLIKNIKFDLRGIPLMDFLYILSKAKLMVCNEGLQTHASSCFNTPCITIFSGLTPYNLSMYNNVTPITRVPQMKCAYCWVLGNCPLYNKAKCIKDIKSNFVLKKIENILEI